MSFLRTAHRVTSRAYSTSHMHLLHRSPQNMKFRHMPSSFALVRRTIGHRSLWVSSQQPLDTDRLRQRPDGLRYQRHQQLYRHSQIVQPNSLMYQHQRGIGGPAGRIIAQLVITVGQIFGQAFMQAFAEAKQNAAKGGGATEAAKSILRKDGMDIAEAYDILNVERGSSNMSEINEKYTKYFEANDPSNGGSLYLQSKVFRAKEAIEKELNDGKESNEKSE